MGDAVYKHTARPCRLERCSNSFLRNELVLHLLCAVVVVRIYCNINLGDASTGRSSRAMGDAEQIGVFYLLANCPQFQFAFCVL